MAQDIYSVAIGQTPQTFKPTPSTPKPPRTMHTTSQRYLRPNPQRFFGKQMYPHRTTEKLQNQKPDMDFKVLEGMAVPYHTGRQLPYDALHALASALYQTKGLWEDAGGSSISCILPMIGSGMTALTALGGRGSRMLGIEDTAMVSKIERTYC